MKGITLLPVVVEEKVKSGGEKGEGQASCGEWPSTDNLRRHNLSSRSLCSGYDTGHISRWEEELYVQ